MGKRMAFLVGDGRRVRFWPDRWCTNEPLRDAFPSLFSIAASKEAWVAEVWNGAIEKGCWAPRFLRSLNDWELEEVESFLEK